MFLYSHDWNAPLARRSAGRLNISKESDGIYFTANPADTTRTADLIKDIEAGNIQGNSFGFVVLEDEWSKDENGTNIRKILKGILYEISAVVNPAYPDTTIAKRSLSQFVERNKPKPNYNLLEARLRLLKLK
jgi:HK97 family phage prohead protease